MQAEARAHHEETDRRDGQKGREGEHMDIADEGHGKAWQGPAFQRAGHALVACREIKPERRCRRSRDVERDTGHDEIGAEPVDRKRHEPAQKRAHDKRRQQADGRASRCGAGQNGDEGRDQHHAFHADIEHARPVGNHHAQSGQQQWCRHTQDRADEMRVENLCKNGAHACTPGCTAAWSASRLRRLRISRKTVG